MGRHVTLAGLAMILVAASLAARADGERDRNSYQKELESWSATIVALQELDKSSQSSREIEHIRNLVSQAQAFVAAGELEEIALLMERSAALAALVQARSARVVAEEEAKAAEIAAEKAEAAAEVARQAAEAAQTKYDELEAKGL